MKFRKLKCKKHGCVLAPLRGSGQNDIDNNSGVYFYQKSTRTSSIKKKKRTRKNTKNLKGEGSPKKIKKCTKKIKKCKAKTSKKVTKN